MRKLLPLLILVIFAIALTASAQNRMSPQRAAGIKADLAGPDRRYEEAGAGEFTMLSASASWASRNSRPPNISAVFWRRKASRSSAAWPESPRRLWRPGFQGKPVIALGSDIDDIPQASQESTF